MRNSIPREASPGPPAFAASAVYSGTLVMSTCGKKKSTSALSKTTTRGAVGCDNSSSRATRSRTTSGPMRFIGGALNVACRTLPTSLVLMVSYASVISVSPSSLRPDLIVAALRGAVGLAAATTWNEAGDQAEPHRPRQIALRLMVSHAPRFAMLCRPWPRGFLERSKSGSEAGEGPDFLATAPLRWVRVGWRSGSRS